MLGSAAPAPGAARDRWRPARGDGPTQRPSGGVPGLTGRPTYDAIVVGGGHNALVAAAYLGRAGKRVLILERLPEVGGAAVSAHAFSGVDARLSRYSYLVSLLPARIVDDLGAPVRLARRRFSSYTPDPATAGRTGLLIGPHPIGPHPIGPHPVAPHPIGPHPIGPHPTAPHADSFASIGAAGDAAGFAEFYRRCGMVTQALWPTLLSPLPTRTEARKLVLDGPTPAEAWRALIDEPIGSAITAAVSTDLVRGVIGTDALIGTFARLGDASLRQNTCFLYHLIGGGTGDWDVPIGGMGAVTTALADAATRYGVEICTNAEVFAIDPDGEVRYRLGDEECRAHGSFVLSGVAPAVLARLVGETAPATLPGAQVKVNLIVRRLPRLRDESVTAEQAFGGTLHINETATQLEEAYSRAFNGGIPDPLPCEIYCHSLTDPTILAEPLRASGAHTLTVFGLHIPHGFIDSTDPDALRSRLTDAVLDSVNSVLAEPIQELLMQDADGRDCIETKTTVDLERTLRMTGGNIFHGGLAWPFAEDDEPLDSPARRWGVASRHERILLCGSASRRGGAVSGIGGHNAAMAVMESKS